jgi:membrane protein YqaA with SNARE-associated domain
MKKIPIFPLSVLGFYIILMVLWNLHIIPSSHELIQILENFYQDYGYLGLFLATLLEGTAYICLYFPGAFIIALTVFFSNQSFVSLLTISAIVAMTLMLSAFISYQFGRFIHSRKTKDGDEFVKETKTFSKGLVASMIHPNFLAFYFFKAGLEKQNMKQILFVPLLMFPYGLLIAYILSVFSTPLRQGLERPSLMFFVIIAWVLISYWKENKNHEKS